jgi:hypothetical protein
MSSAVKRFNAVKIILNKSIFDENIIHIILKYYWKDLKNKRKVLLDWIDIELLSWDILLARDQNKMDWRYLCSNPNAIDLLENNQDKINWKSLCLNPNAIDLLSANENKIYWESLSKNPNAIDLLNKRIQFENTSTKEELYWLDLENNIDWYSLSLNSNAIELLTNNQDKIDWESLSANPNAIYLLKNNVDEIDWYWLSVNPSIFENEPMPIV